ncbi:MAG: LytTR family DNA-binding domain-containing protein [Pseudomonadota bacterium]
MALLLGAGAGLSGPFGTFRAMPLPMSVLYWELIIAIGFAIWWALEKAVAAFRPTWTGLSVQLAVVLPFSLLNAVSVQGINTAIAALSSQDVWTSYQTLVGSHLTFSMIVVLPVIAVSKRLLQNAEDAGGVQAIDFLTLKLPDKLRASVPFALSAEGSYVRVYTAAGDDIIAMRFEDAIRAVSGINGVQTHRSWWVASSAINTLRKAGSAYELTLHSGLIAPVGRRRRAEVAAVLEANS